MNRYNRLTGSIKCTKFVGLNKAKKLQTPNEDINVCLNCEKAECKTGHCEKIGTKRERYYDLKKIKKNEVFVFKLSNHERDEL